MSSNNKSRCFRGRGGWKYRGRGSSRPFRDFNRGRGKSFGETPPSVSGSQQVITAVFPTTQGPCHYKGWKLYHPQESESEATVKFLEDNITYSCLLSKIKNRCGLREGDKRKVKWRDSQLYRARITKIREDGKVDVQFLEDKVYYTALINNVDQHERVQVGDIRPVKWLDGRYYKARILRLKSTKKEIKNVPNTGLPTQSEAFTHEVRNNDNIRKKGFMEGSPTVNKIRAVEGYLQRHHQLFNSVDIEERRCCALDTKQVLGDSLFIENWSSFEQDLLEEPEHTINCLGLAIHQYTLNELEKDMSEEDSLTVDLPAIRIRLLNYEPIAQLKNLKANLYGKLVCVRGTIIRVGNMKLLCTWLGFRCNACGSVQTVKQPEGLYTQPTVCGSTTCRARSFTSLCSSPLTQTLNWQTVRLQELVDDDQREGGRVPRTVEVELTEDLVDSCVPGDEVTVTGIVKVRSTEEGKKSKTASMFVLYIHGVSVASSKASSGSGRMSGIEFNIKDYYAIQEIHSEPSLLRLLVNSLCPSIYGHEMVKAGLLLGLLGGSQSNHGRSDSHILVVGDPGLGKSQMLQACASVAPRGVYVCGNTSTASGLTVTLTREGGGDFALEAGALVLADQGCCCIDEFDKMSVQHQALLEAMEQQVISIAKAGVVCSLPARTAILAAANPASGHYNRAKTVSENLRMGQPLLSRFDLVFILLDRPNEQLDSLLSEHVMALHSGVKRTSDGVSVTSSTQSNLPACDISLSERLKLNGEPVDLLPHALLRKYIAYARKYVPGVRLSGEAARVLQHFYLELRKQHQTLDSTPVTTRQLESLIRLTQARAKAELREVATEQDAVDVMELMRWSMVDTFIDEFGALDFHRSIHGSGSSSKNQAKKFITALQKKAELQAKSVFSVAEMKEVAALAKIQIGDFFTFVSNLNTQGFLIKKGKQMYQLLSVDY